MCVCVCVCERERERERERETEIQIKGILGLGMRHYFTIVMAGRGRVQFFHLWLPH